MATIKFYEKPGCINNGKQKTILQNAGHQVNSIDILSHVWTRKDLVPFLVNDDPADFMNMTAPAIKRGEIVPAALGFEEALQLMIRSPILIKRPLIEVDGLFLQGFTDSRLQPYLGDWDQQDDVVTCPNLQDISCDEKNALQHVTKE